jgi:hypothetical protein
MGGLDKKKTYNFLKKRTIFLPVAVRQHQQRLSVIGYQLTVIGFLSYSMIENTVYNIKKSLKFVKEE